MAQGDAELDQVQIHDWDEEAEEDEATTEEEEELARVQQEIERLRQEQESIVRRQAAAQRAEARRQNINRERARLTELQYTLDILRQQEQRQEAPLDQIPHQSPPPPSHNQIPHQPPPPPPHYHFFHQQPSPPKISTTNPKSPLAEHLQLIPWPLHYRAVPPPKYHDNIEPRKFLMCYKDAIASAGGDETTLAK
jgi:hypothetical protein